MTTRRRALSLLVVSSWLLAGAGPRPAEAQLLGSEFRVNSYTTGYQSYPAVAVEAAGGFVVVWQAYVPGGSYGGVRGQRFDAAGAPVGPEFPVSSFPGGSQGAPAVAAGDAGGFVVVWESWGQDGSYVSVFGQRFDSGGVPAGGEFQVNTYTTGYQSTPAVACDAAGDFVVVWQSWEQDGAGYGVFGQRFDATGAPAGDEFQVNGDSTFSQSRPAVAADGAGNFLVVWQSDDGNGNGIYARRYDAAGVPAGGEFRVNSYTTHNQREPAATAVAGGGFVVVWQSYAQDGSDSGVFGQRLDASAAPVGSEFRVNTYTSLAQHTPAVAAGDAGDFVVAWESFGQDGYIAGIFGRRFDAAGRPTGGDFLVNGVTTNNQTSPAVAADGSGDFVVAWTSYGQDGSYQGIFGRLGTAALFADGFEPGDACAWSSAVGGGCP